MYKTQPSSRAIQRARISWQQAQVDFKEAKTVLEFQPHKSSLLSTQAAMNALSSILEARGYFQFPVFSTSELLKKCIEEEKVFEVLHSACAVLDGTVERDMFQSTRTPQAQFTPAFARACLKACGKIQKVTNKYWKQNRNLLSPKE